jgi:hypothetical protein
MGGAWCAALNLDHHMITVANRATPQPLTLEQQENAMTNEGASPEGRMPEPVPAKPTAPSASSVRSTLHLHTTQHGEQGAGKA